MGKKDSNKKNSHKEDSLKDQVEDAIDNAIEQVEGEEKDKAEAGKPSELDQIKTDLEKEKEKFLRLFAEFENYKKRTSKERVELFKTANQDVMMAMLPVLDDFDRALNEINKSGDKNLIKGVELIHNKFRETLKNKGLETIKVEKGEAFDADIHEAITQIPAPSDDLKGKIVDVVEKGYKLGDRIIRYPKVVTGQ